MRTLFGLLALLAVMACAETQQAQRQQFSDSVRKPVTPPVQAELSEFDGQWVGSGSNARAAFRTRCGGGPLVNIDIQNGRARGVFTFHVRIRRGMEHDMRTDVIPLNGTLDDHGRLELTGFQSDVIAVLSARNGSGDGSWETRSLACHGTFLVRNRN